MNELILKYGNTDDQQLKYATRNCAILGANGSGKTSLIRKLLQYHADKTKITPISSQRNLTLKQGSLKGRDDNQLDDSTVSFNNADNSRFNKQHIHQLYNRGDHSNLIQSDFNENIEKLFRDHNNTIIDYSGTLSTGDTYTEQLTKAKIAFSVWNTVFVNRTIVIKDGKIKVIFGDEEYEIENLSDGERSALYLIVKCIHAPENGIILIDEGETHLNPALLQELRDQIEMARPDCRFIYTSHDINFITSRSDCTKFWIRNFNYPDNWEIEEINDETLPEDLIIQIIGSKKEKILFVESTDSGLDKRLYQYLYPDFSIIPLGSCEDVISYTKILNDSTTAQTYDKEYYGLIDRDFRDQSQINTLKNQNIYTLPVTEFENLFFKKEIIQFLFNHLGRTDFEEKFELLKSEIFSLKDHSQFKKDFYKYHIQQAFNQSLSGFEVGESFEFGDDYSSINILRNNIQKENDYDALLEIINTKAIKGIANQLGYCWNEYFTQIINLFNTDKSNELKEEFLRFMPSIG